MQALNTVKMQDLLLVEGDMNTVIPVVNILPDGTVETADERYFLKTAYRCPVIVVVDGVSTVDHYEYLNPGKIYKCKSYVYTDPGTGDKSTQYKWVSITFAENGALAACELTTPIVKETTSTGTTVRIIWSDPADKTNATDSRGNPDPAANAIWAYTVVVRKQGDTAPTTVYDGEIVGYSSVRNQYNNSTGFIDLEPDGVNYTYNVFAVTRYGVATGLEGSEPTEIDWEGIQTAIRAGKAGAIFGLGDIITVEHNIFGSLQMQVVAIDNAVIDTDPVKHSEQVGLTHSVTFMSERVITRVTYDAPEAEIVDSEVNPGDVQKIDNYKVSAHGRATWAYSNMRQWLNCDSGYSDTTDTKYISTKCYFTKDDAGTYELVAIPTDPSSINPSEKGWYESMWIYTAPSDNKWDLCPGTKSSTDADYVKDFVNGDNRRLPGFLTGFSHASGSKKGLVDVLLYVNNTTVNDRFIYNIATNKSTVTSDRVFIPSYRELTGNEPLGARVFGEDVARGEGVLFPFFDRTKTIPGLTSTRSLLKLDLNGNLSGYYTRTIGTDTNASDVWDMIAPSRLWTVNVCDYRTQPDLGKAVTKVYHCAMSKDEAIERTTSTGELYAPGIAFCFVIG